MAESTKTLRLSKVARELNIGLTTIFDFLDSQGIEIEKSPNTKIPSEAYDMLLNEFQSEKAVREESKLVGLDKPAMETITLGDNDQEKEKPKDAEEIVATEVQEEDVSEETDKKPKVGPKVIGKIDVDKVQGKDKKVTKKDSSTVDNTKVKEAPADKEKEKKRRKT